MNGTQRHITTLTLNPAIDETITLDRLDPGTVLRARTVRFNAGGKGLNVAACLADGGFDVAAGGLLGSENRAFFQNFLAGRGIEDRFITLQGATRTNIKLITPDSTTDINLPGLKATQDALEAIRRAVALMHSDYLVLAGSLPPGCPDDFYAGLVAGNPPEVARTTAVRIIADCSGQPFRALMQAGRRPFCIKPNRDELAEWAGRPLTTQDCLLDEARKLHESGIALVAVSMGKDGALFVSNEGAVHAAIRIERVESTVGAGDAMVAGIVAALSHDAALEDIARNATAWAAGKLQCQGPSLPAPSRIAELARATCCTFLDRN